jgi:hypothetical protein
VQVLLLFGWASAALLLGLAAGVTRMDLLLVVPATVMAVALVVTGGARLGALLLAVTLTMLPTVLLAVTTWGRLPGVVPCVTALLVADKVTSFLRQSGRRSTGPFRGLNERKRMINNGIAVIGGTLTATNVAVGDGATVITGHPDDDETTVIATDDQE